MSTSERMVLTCATAADALATLFFVRQMGPHGEIDVIIPRAVLVSIEAEGEARATLALCGLTDNELACTACVRVGIT